MTSRTIRDRIRAIERVQRTIERDEERIKRRSHQLAQQLRKIHAQCSHLNLEENRDAWGTSFRCPDCGMCRYESLPANVRAAHIRVRYEELERKECTLRAQQ